MHARSLTPAGAKTISISRLPQPDSPGNKVGRRTNWALMTCKVAQSTRGPKQAPSAWPNHKRAFAILNRQRNLVKTEDEPTTHRWRHSLAGSRMRQPGDQFKLGEIVSDASTMFSRMVPDNFRLRLVPRLNQGVGMSGVAGLTTQGSPMSQPTATPTT
jgi:hypothetical protein